MRLIVGILSFLLFNSAWANFEPLDTPILTLPCESVTRPVRENERTDRSTREFLAFNVQPSCQSESMVENLYLLGGYESPFGYSSYMDGGSQDTIENTRARYDRNRNSIENGSAFAIQLIKSQQFDQAIGVLQPLYQTARFAPIVSPFELREDFKADRIALQLAYAHELKGDVATALNWAQASYSLSHRHSVWLYIEVLQAKAKHTDKWFENHSVLNLPFRTEGFFADRIGLKIHGNAAALRETIDTVASFLYERIPLVPNNDPVVAGILFDLGYLVALDGDFENAQYVFQLSQIYGDHDASQSQMYFTIQETTQHIGKWFIFGISALGLLAGWGFVAVMYRIFLHFCARLYGLKFWMGAVGLGGSLSALSLAILNTINSFVFALDTTGRTQNIMEILMLLGAIGGVIIGAGLAWSVVLQREISVVGSKYWVFWGLWGVWIMGWSVVGAQWIIPTNTTELILDKILPIVLILPAAASFVFWAHKMRAATHFNDKN